MTYRRKMVLTLKNALLTLVSVSDSILFVFRPELIGRSRFEALFM